MDGCLRLSARERKTCFGVYRRDRRGRRALVLLLLADRRSYREIAAAMFASPSLIAAVKRDFAAGGVDRVLGRELTPCVVASWLILVVRFLVNHTPQDFDFF